MTKLIPESAGKFDEAVKALAELGFNEDDARETLCRITGYSPDKKQKPTVSDINLILSSDDKHFGVVVNPNSMLCRMEGCTGRRMYVRWDDGVVTFPCSKGVRQTRPLVCKIG